jgi:hypothetical protein
MRLFISHDLDYGFDELIIVDSIHFLHLFYQFFYFLQFYLQILNWLKIKLYNFFLFAFYWVIMIS